DRGRLLLMMYEGALKFLRQSKAGLEQNDIGKFCRFLSKAQAIIAELMNTLDFEKGGKIAKDLDRLYDFMLFYLTEANLHRDAERITKVIGLLDTVYSAYKEIIEDDKAKQRQESSTSASGDAQVNSGAENRRVQISL
ncbi:MAG: flagellar export chaperone FliS, partial [Bdellovibrionales bacterium]|nr:flagellar export chaperone FliS [Bdellovibrionales bacterium]